MDLYAEVKNGPGSCGGPAFARRGTSVLPLREMERGREGWQPAEGVDAGHLPPWRRGAFHEAAELACRTPPGRRQAIRARTVRNPERVL
jgi:hypothetical protein